MLYFTYHTTTPRLPWRSASSRQGQTERTRFAGEKIGAAAAITLHASCATSLSTTPRITSRLWLCRHTRHTPQQACTCGVMTTMEHTDNFPWTTPKTRTSCYIRRTGPPCGATMSCSSAPQPVCGATTALATPWSQCPGSSSCAPRCIMWMTMAAPKSEHSSSGFQAFEDFNGALGYRMKPSKRQAPAQTHKIQGVNITIEPQHVVLTPCPQRVQRMRQDILAWPGQ